MGVCTLLRLENSHKQALRVIKNCAQYEWRRGRRGRLGQGFAATQAQGPNRLPQRCLHTGATLQFLKRIQTERKIRSVTATAPPTPTALRAVALSAFYGCRWVIVLRFDDGSTGRLGLRRTTWCAVTSSPCAAAAAAPPHPPAVPPAGPRPRWRRRCTGTRGSDSSTARCSGSIGRPSTPSLLFQKQFSLPVLSRVNHTIDSEKVRIEQA